MTRTTGEQSPRGLAAAASVTPTADRGGAGSAHDPNNAIRDLAEIDHHHNARDGGESDDEGEDPAADLFVYRSHGVDDGGIIAENFPDHGVISLSDPQVPPMPPHASTTQNNDATFASTGTTTAAPGKSIPGAPDGWKVPGQPDDWVYNKRPGEPDFTEVDNPGNWPPYDFRSKFSGTGKAAVYKRHELPAGATPVPKGDDGKRIKNGYEFHYNGYSSSTQHRGGADKADICPPDRGGSLDVEILKGLGVTTDTVQNGDAFTFLDLVLPVVDPKHSDFNTDDFKDPRKGYYPEVQKNSNIYRFQEDSHGRTPAGPYGHQVAEVSIEDLVHFDSIVGYDGALGGSDGAIHTRWMLGEDYDGIYNLDIAQTMPYSRFLEIKRVYKLNNNDKSPSKDDPSWASHKFDFIGNTIVHNVNALTKTAERDLTVDESTWPFGGYGPAGAGLCVKGLKKPGASKGGQIVLCTDAHRPRIRAFVNRCKIVERRKPKGWSNGEFELKLLLDQLDNLTEGSSSKLKKIFDIKAHLTTDNYFNGYKIRDEGGRRGYGLLQTLGRGYLFKEDVKQHFHHQKTGADERTKSARYLTPIVAVKQVPAADDALGYDDIITSFQSTSSCNISAVNSINSCELYCLTKHRGRNEHHRAWGVEMNQARQLYLRTYNRVDVIDHYVKHLKMCLISWKYWFPPMLLWKGIAIVQAYDIYTECCEGNLDPDWKADPISFHMFFKRAMKSGLQYKVTDRKRGEGTMRKCTQQSKAARANAKRVSPSLDGRVSSEQLQHQFSRHGSSPPQICGDLSVFEEHCSTIVAHTSEVPCDVCGEKTRYKCMACLDKAGNPGAPMHYVHHKGKGKSHNLCFIRHHCQRYCGLKRNDCAMVGKKVENWKSPSKSQVEENASHVKRLKLMEE